MVSSDKRPIVGHQTLLRVTEQSQRRFGGMGMNGGLTQRDGHIFCGNIIGELTFSGFLVSSLIIWRIFEAFVMVANRKEDQ